MKRVVNKLPNCKVEVVCDIDTAVWKEAQEKAFKKLASELEIKGFRKGQAPEAMARKHIDQGKIINEAINLSLQPAFEEVLKEEGLEPFTQPKVDVTKVSDTDLQLKFIIVVAPEVKLGEYKNLGIEKDKVSVTKAEIDAEVEKLVAQNASLVVTDKAAKKGDTVVIDFCGSIDGVEFDGGKAENYSLELGSNSFVPGFEDQLVGAKAGDKVSVKVTFPKQYVKELAGKDAVFACKVHEVKEKVVPELNKDLIKELAIPEVKDVEGLRKHLESQIKGGKEQQASSKLLDAILDKIVANSKIEIADEIIDEETAGQRKNVEAQMQQRGLTLEQYYEITGSNEERMMKDLRADAERNLRGILVMNEIAKVEKLTVTQAEIDLEFANIAKQYNMEVEKVKEILGKDMARFANEIRSRKIATFLVMANEKKAEAKAAAEKPAEKKPAAKKPAAKKASK